MGAERQLVKVDNSEKFDFFVGGTQLEGKQKRLENELAARHGAMELWNRIIRLRCMQEIEHEEDSDQEWDFWWAF